MDLWDVIVAGAGQAGCAAAWDLAAGGARVLLLHGGPARAKPCAGGLTLKVVNRYRFAIDAVVRERIDQLALSRAGRGRARAGTAAPFCVMTHRRELDDLCRLRARQRGADWRRSAGVRALAADRDGVTLTTQEGDRLRGRYLIAADGAHSPLRRLLHGQGPVSGAVALEAHLPREEADYYPPMTLDFEQVPGGYGWLFPKGDHVNLGLYVWRRDRARPTIAALRDYARRTLGTWLHRRPPVGARILFVGDAAGATEPLLGEGIYGAVLSGQLAAQSLLADRPGDYPLLLGEWRDELRQVERLAGLFYGLMPISYLALSRWLAPILLAGYARGWTLGQTKRAWRGAHSRPELGSAQASPPR